MARPCLGPGNCGAERLGETIEAVREFHADESGVAAIEYGLIAALVSIAAMGAFGLVGDSLVKVFLDGVADVLTDAAAST